MTYEGLDPLEGGALRLKYRKDRCPGLPIESPLAFYPRVIGGTIAKAFGYARTVWAFRKIMIEVRDAPDRTAYSDAVIVPQGAEEFEGLALYQATSGGEAALARRKRDDTIRGPTPRSSPIGRSRSADAPAAAPPRTTS